MCGENHEHPEETPLPEMGWWDGLICYLAYGIMYLAILSIIACRIEGVEVDDGHDHSGHVHETFHVHETSHQDCESHHEH